MGHALLLPLPLASMEEMNLKLTHTFIVFNSMILALVNDS
jgi:hypothetical protein